MTTTGRRSHLLRRSLPALLLTLLLALFAAPSGRPAAGAQPGLARLAGATVGSTSARLTGTTAVSGSARLLAGAAAERTSARVPAEQVASVPVAEPAPEHEARTPSLVVPGIARVLRHQYAAGTSASRAPPPVA
ncbi:hypothetical protein [Actinoplanes sp. NBRC 101535]|uniref:hypothetical protein n=1 Tax=Actinoplanes sp. NBRC 101535 TaxID=3032196 RepID=UPI0024A31248|nr:hypothetical protein [Actinoplanes sp. NBRC 101535]GLY01300.1 hypothetical protein Acsp01_16790 [Actinoplanes sp. NBRC 101535]